MKGCTNICGSSATIGLGVELHLIILFYLPPNLFVMVLYLKGCTKICGSSATIGLGVELNLLILSHLPQSSFVVVL